MSDMFTNVRSYSSKSIAALSSDHLIKVASRSYPTFNIILNILKAIRQGSTAQEVGHEREDRWLRDPCWRAKRVGLQYQPSQYYWREKLGMQERLSSQSLSRSTPNISQLTELSGPRLVDENSKKQINQQDA